MGDFNEALGADPLGMELLSRHFHLQDILHQRIGTSDFGTYFSGTTRIDYALATQGVATACIAAGYEPVGHRFQGDHRGFFIDFNDDLLFGNKTATLASPAQRILSSRHPNNCKKYINARHKYLTDHLFFERLKTVTEDPTYNPERIEKLNRDWVRSAIHAEKKCSRISSTPFSRRITAKRTRKFVLGKII